MRGSNHEDAWILTNTMRNKDTQQKRDRGDRYIDVGTEQRPQASIKKPQRDK